MSTSSSTPAISSDVAELKDMVRALILDRKNQTPASAPVIAVEQCVAACGPCYQANSSLYFRFGLFLANTVTNPKEDLKVSLPVVVVTIQDRKLVVQDARSVTKDTMPYPTNNGTSTVDVANSFSTASPTLTPFGDSDFLLFEEADSFLALEDDPTSSEVDPTYQDPEGDILLLEAILNSEPPPSSQIKNNICLELGKNSNSVKIKLLNLPLMNLQRLNSKTYLPILNTHSWKMTTSYQSSLLKN
ncbi:hypothetical protein Tco_0404694 [Tanacetum coccineum]